MPHHPNTSHPFTGHRFTTRHSGPLATLTSNRLLAFSASSIIGIFFPIFLFEFFNLSITAVLVWYAIMYAARLPVHIIAAKIFSKTGLVPSMIIGTIGAVIFYLSSYFLDAGTFNETFLLITAAAGIVILAGFYWTPFHTDFAMFLTKGRQGRQISFFRGTEQVIAVIAPVAGGWLVTQYSYGIIFVFGILMLILSIFPLMNLPKTHVMYEFGFLETFQKMFSKKFLSITISMIALGAESMVGMVIWPIFLFVIFKGEYLEIGAFAGVIMIIGLILETIIGRQVDKGQMKKLLKFGDSLYALGWMGKALVTTTVGVFAASTFHTLGSIFLRTPFSAIYYEKAADSGHYVDEYTVVRETALTLGRLLMSGLLIILTAKLSLSAAFVAAAIVSLGMMTLAKIQIEKS